MNVTPQFTDTAIQVAQAARQLASADDGDKASVTQRSIVIQEAD